MYVLESTIDDKGRVAVRPGTDVRHAKKKG
jgi:hypothetical protein